MPKITATWLLFTGCLCIQPAISLGDEIVSLDGFAQAGGVSADGETAVATIGLLPAQGIVWNREDGAQNLGGVEVDGLLSSMTAVDISADGTVVTGTASNDILGTTTFGKRAYRRTEASGFVDLGHLGANNSTANGISADGNVIVGHSADLTGRNRAFRWIDGAGMLSLGETDSDETSATARAASGDGSVIVGASNALISGIDTNRAFSWTEGGGMVLLPVLDGPLSNAFDISTDGTVIVGSAQTGFTTVATRWVDGSIEALNGPSGSPESSIAYGVSGDGEVIVGTYTGGVPAAFRWTEDGGMQTVEQWLRDAGVTIENDTTLVGRAANDDGSVIIGTTNTDDLFIARVSSGDDSGSGGSGSGGGGSSSGSGGGDDGGSGSSGLITLNDLNASLGNAATANASNVGAINLLLNGAGSRPLDKRAPTGRVIGWLGGDWGRDDHDARNGHVGLGEIGLGRNLGDVQVIGVVGVTSNVQNTALGGRSEMLSTYAKLETMGKLYGTDESGLWGILSATALIGEADITRNYIANGGATSSSTGQTDVAGFGIRGRLQWENMITHFSPYLEASHSRACMDGYTETGGAFAAQFNRLCDTATQARVGVDARLPINAQIDLIGTLEGVHQFEKQGQNITGNVTGLGGFDLASSTHQQNWLRAGLGVEVQLGDTTLSAMGNLTTRGETQNAWLAAHVRTVF